MNVSQSEDALSARTPDRDTRATACLLIHAAAATGPNNGRSPLQWLCALFQYRALRSQRGQLRLNIADLHGRQVLATEVGGLLTVVSLPAGTYHVDAHLGNVRRRYTMTLEQGASFDLYLDLVPVRPLSMTD